MHEMVQIGKVLKHFGTKGLIKVHIESMYESSFESSDHLFVKRQGSFVPLFIVEMRHNGLEWEILLEDLADNPEEAKKLNGLDVYLRNKNIHSDAHESKEKMLSLTDFRMIHAADKTEIGKISRVEIYPQQLIAMVQTSSGEKMIPLNESFLIDISETNKEVIVDLPEGLLDL
jgi:16S rRNA processing protein RimM